MPDGSDDWPFRLASEWGDKKDWIKKRMAFKGEGGERNNVIL